MSLDVSTLAIEVKSSGISDASSGLNKVYIEAGKAEKRVKTLTDSVIKLDAAFGKGLASVQAFATSLSQIKSMGNVFSGGTSKTLSTEMESLQKATSKSVVEQTLLGKAVGTSSKELGNNTSSVKNLTNAKKNFSKVTQEAHAVVRGFSGSLGALWMTYGNILPMMVGIIAGASFKGAITSGAAFEQTMEGIRVKSQESTESVAALRETALKLGEGVYGANEVATAMEIMSMAGLNAQEVLSGIKDALNLAVTGGTSLESSANTLVTVGTAAGIAAQNYGVIADIIAKAAAVSNTSVEGISAAMRSGAAVNKMYGESLEGMATQFALISNLGIDFTSAGTNMKNMYKQLTSNTASVTETLGKLGVKIRDSNTGALRPMYDIIADLSDEMKKYDKAAQDAMLKTLSNAQGQRMLVALQDAYNNKIIVGGVETNKYANALKEVSNSAAFAAVSMAQLSLTTQNQMKSVKNAFETVLIKTFEELEPQVNTFAARLKEVFKSDEFKDAIKGITNAIGNLGMFLTSNLSGVAAFTAALIALKAAMAFSGLFTAMSAGIQAMGVGMGSLRVLTTGATVAVTGFGVALRAATLAIPIIGVVLTVAAAAWGAYELATSKSTSATEEKAKAYTGNLLSSLKEEIDRSGKVNELLKKGIDLRKAEVRVMQDQATEKMDLANKDRVEAAKKALDEVALKYRDVSEEQMKASLEFQNVERVYTNAMYERQNAMIETKASIGLLTKLKQNEHDQVSVQNEARKKQEGELLALEKDKTNSVMAHTRAALARFEIQKKTQEMQLEAEYKSGTIGEMGKAIEMSMLNAESATTKAKLAYEAYTSATGKGKDSAKAKWQEAQETAKLSVYEETQRLSIKFDEITRKLHAQNVKDYIELEKKRGNYTLSVQEEYQEKYLNKQKGYSKDMELSEAAMAALKEKLAQGGTAVQQKEVERQLATWQKYYKELEQAQILSKEKGVVWLADAQLKTAMTGANELFQSIKLGIEEINEKASEDGGWIARFNSAEEVYKFKQRTVPELIKKLEELKIAAADINIGSQKRGEASAEMRQIQKFLNQIPKAYKTTIKQIDDIVVDGLDAAFSKSAGNWKDYVKKMKDTFRKMFIEEIYKMFLKPFVMTIVANVAGMVGFSGLASAATTAAGGASSLLGGASAVNAGTSMWSAFSGGLTSGIGGIVTKAGELFGSSAVTAFGQGIAGDAIAGIIAGEAGAATLGASFAAAIPYLGVAAIVVGLWDKMFGMGPKKTTATGVTGTVGLEGADVQNFNKWKQKGGWFRSDKKGVDYSDVAASVQLVFDKANRSMFTALDNLTDSIGISADVISGFSAAIEVNLKDVEKEDYDEVFATAFSKTSDTLTAQLVDKFRSSITTIVAELQKFYIDYDEDGNRKFKVRSETSVTETVEQTPISSSVDAYMEDILRLTDAFKVGTVGVAGLEGQYATFVQNVFSMAAAFEQNTKVVRVFGESLDFGKIEAAAFSAENVVETFARLTQVFNATNVVAKLLGKNVEAAFGSVGLASTAVREKLIELSGGLETFAAQAEYYMQNFLTEAERTAYATDNLKIAFSDLGLTMPTTRDAFRSLIEGLDLTTEAGMKMYASLMNLAPSIVAVTEASESLAATALANAKAALDEAESNLRAAYERESALLQQTIDKFKNFAKALRDFQKSLFTSDLTTLTLKQQYSVSRANLLDVAARAKAGDETAMGELQGVSEEFLTVSQGYSEDFVQYQKDFKLVSFILDETANTAEAQASIAQKQLAALNELVSGYITINESVLSVVEAIRELLSLLNPQEEIATGGASGGASVGTRIVDTGAGGNLSIKSGGGVTFTGATEDYLLGISAKVKEGYATVINPVKDALSKAGIDFSDFKNYGEYSDYETELFKVMANGGITEVNKIINGSHADGLDYVPFDGYVAELHKGERVQTAKQVETEETMQTMIASLVETIAAGNRAIAQNTLDTAKQLRRWDGDGLPEVRSEI